MATNISFGTDNTISVTVTNTAGAVVSGATVEVTLKDTSDVNVPGQSWPLSCSEVGSTGVYTGTIDSEISVVRTQTVVAVVTATKSGVPSTSRVNCYVEGDDD